MLRTQCFNPGRSPRASNVDTNLDKSAVGSGTQRWDGHSCEWMRTCFNLAPSGNFMTKILTNLRIGTKLAITSVLSILLIGMMIFGQMSGNAAVRKMNASAVDQQTIANDAMEARASIRGM
jgi:hypothetical protein